LKEDDDDDGGGGGGGGTDVCMAIYNSGSVYNILILLSCYCLNLEPCLLNFPN